LLPGGQFLTLHPAERQELAAQGVRHSRRESAPPSGKTRLSHFFSVLPNLARIVALANLHNRLLLISHWILDERISWYARASAEHED